MNIIAIIATVIGSVVSGATLFFIQRWIKKKDTRDEVRDKAKARENILIMRAIHANGKLTEATALALKRGECNGEMESALAARKETESELFRYLLEQNATKK